MDMHERMDEQEGARALIVDDEAFMRWSLHAELEEHGLVSREVESIEQARAALTDGADVVVLDCRLPDGDGLTLLDEIRAARPYVPVIVLTAHASVDHAVDAMRRGAFHYVCKPVESTDLLSVILDALRPHRTNGESGARAGNGGNGHAGPQTVLLPPEGVILDEVERALLAQALERTGGNRSRAARLLGITRNQIRYRIRKFGLDAPAQPVAVT